MSVWVLRRIVPSQFIGIFSTIEKAQLAATTILMNENDLDEDFEWRGSDEFMKGYNGERPYDTDEFRIVGLELDKPKNDGYRLL